MTKTYTAIEAARELLKSHTRSVNDIAYAKAMIYKARERKWIIEIDNNGGQYLFDAASVDKYAANKKRCGKRRKAK